jgi:succinyl-diaminopimelate desuccinylase
MTHFDRISKWIFDNRDDVVGMMKRFTAIPAIGPENGGDGEAEKAGAVRNELEALGLKVEDVQAPDSRVPGGFRPNLIAKLKGRTSDRTLWIMSHLDVVPVGDAGQWESEPFQAVERDGKLFGRGTEDDNQGIVSSITAVKAFIETGVEPERDLGLIFVSDEEVGSVFGIEHLLKKRPDLFRQGDWIVIPDAGNEDGTMIEIAEKSILWVKAETIGVTTHASTPERGKNAHKAAAHWIVRMNGLHETFPASDPSFDPPISTFEPTRKEPDVPNINTIPGRDVVYFDCRILPCYSIEEVKRRIRTIADEIEREFGVTIHLSYPNAVSAPPPTPADTPVAKALEKAVADVLGRKAKPVGIGGGTVAAFFREAGIPAVCWCTLAATLHGPNEYCKIENLLNDARVFAHLALQE